MTSLRHNPDSEQARASAPDDAYLDAAREAILAVGWSRTTLTDIARRAGVSRMTLYRRWPDTQTLLADLMTREWGHVVESASVRSASVESARSDRLGAPEGGNVLDRIAGGVIATVRSLRDNALLRRIVDVDPEVLLPYLLDRRGRSQEMVAETLAGLIAAGQGEGSVRVRRPRRAGPLAGARLPRLHPVGAHDVRDRFTRSRRVPPRRRARDDGAEVPPAMTKIEVGLAGIPESTDVLVIGLGITGAGVALDAASRGLSVVAVDAHDVAFGTSRWSSKLVHGGLRYLARGQLDVAHESAVERGILMQTTAPHLIRALPMLMPLTPEVTRWQASLARAGFRAGDLLRLGARTGRETLPRPRRIGVTETLTLASVVRPDGLRGGLLSWDGQLEDDVRLVLAVARTAAAEGARVHTRVRVSEPTGTGAVLTDARTGESRAIRARAVVNAAGVWAGDLVEDIHLRPSRGTHLVLRKATLPGVRCAIMAPVPGVSNRFVFALPQPDDTFYVGLTDEEVDEIPDVPVPPEEDIEFLLGVINTTLRRDVRRDQVVGAYAGLRPLLDSGSTTADLSRKHAVLVSGTGVVTVVGGKLTTYRRMAQDAVDRAVATAGLEAAACRTSRLPLVGAGSTTELAAVVAPDRLVRRFGTEAPAVLANAVEVTGLPEDELVAPIAPGLHATLAELVFAVTHEGAATVEDLLDRRTRIGLVPEDRELAVPVAQKVLELAG